MTSTYQISESSKSAIIIGISVPDLTRRLNFVFEIDSKKSLLPDTSHRNCVIFFWIRYFNTFMEPLLSENLENGFQILVLIRNAKECSYHIAGVSRDNTNILPKRTDIFYLNFSFFKTSNLWLSDKRTKKLKKTKKMGSTTMNFYLKSF